MAIPFANAQQYNSTLTDDHIIGIQIGNSTDDAGLAQMKHIKVGLLKSFIREGFGQAWTYRGEYDDSLPDNLAVNDYFLASATFTVDEETFTANHLYAWNGTEWSDISGILSAYATKTDLGLKADKVLSPTSGDVVTLESTGNITDSGVSISEILTESDVVDNVTSDVTDKPLSAKQGKNLEASKVNVVDIVNSVSSTATDKPLSANMGYEIQQEIENLKARGRFLSLWDCITGLPETNPVELPYTYQTGDYYIVSKSILSLMEDSPDYDATSDYAVGDFVLYNGDLYECNTAITGGEVWNSAHWDERTNNYIPSGSTYTGTASSTTTTDEVKTNDFYWYDGTNWLLLNNTSKTLSFANITGDPHDNPALAAEFNDVVRHDSNLLSGSVPINADQLNGHSDTYFGTASAVAANASAISSLGDNSWEVTNINQTTVTVSTSDVAVGTISNYSKYRFFRITVNWVSNDTSTVDIIRTSMQSVNYVSFYNGNTIQIKISGSGVVTAYSFSINASIKVSIHGII